MNKIQLSLLSLVGALPAGFLTYLLGMYLINQPSGASSMVMIISILTLICTAALTLTPVLILALYHSNYDPPKAVKAAKEKKAKKGEDLDDDDDQSSAKAGADDDDVFADGDDMLDADDDDNIEMTEDDE